MGHKRSSELRKRERFVSNVILESISRPQYKYSCSLAALTAAINFLYSEKIGIQTQEMLAGKLGMDASEVGYNGGPDNEELLEWFGKFVKRVKLHGSCRCYLSKREVKDFSKNDRVFL